LNRFSFGGCKILWDKRTRTPKRDKAVIKADLKTMSSIAEEAMTYTKNKVLKENRETLVRFWLNTNTSLSYYVDIYYDSGLKAWNFSICVVGELDKIIGEIVSEKWPCLQILQDENVEEESF